MIRKWTGALFVLFVFNGFLPQAIADNALTQDELLKITKLSMDDYTSESPEHAKHLSGFKVSTVGADAKVVLSITHDGMTMTENYFCVRQAPTFVCTQQ